MRLDNQRESSNIGNRQGQRVVPDSFTHGTSEQPVRWLTVGFRSGDRNACDTVSIPASRL